jgi:hypothetical protein
VTDIKQWAKLDAGFLPCGETLPRLKPGYYRPDLLGGGGMFAQLTLKPIVLVTDDLFVLRNSPVEHVIHTIRKFWDAKDLYAKHGLIHKRGILLHGSPGTGKTSIVNMVARFFANNGGVVFYAGNDEDALPAMRQAILKFRQIQDEPLLLILEDFDSVQDNSYTLSMAMQLMDGVDQVNNVVFLCTTNFLHKIDDRFTKRPSRIDEVIEIEQPSAEARKDYLARLLMMFSDFGDDENVTAAEMETYATKTEGLLLAHLKEVVIATKILGQPLDATVARLKSMVVENNPAGTPKYSNATFTAPPISTYLLQNAAERRLKDKR